MYTVKRAAIVAILFLVAGCASAPRMVSSAPGYNPIIHLDSKPVMESMTPEERAKYESLDPEIRNKIGKNVQELAKDSLKCRKSVERYNIWAGTQNEMTAKALGLERWKVQKPSGAEGGNDGSDDVSRPSGDKDGGSGSGADRIRW